MKIARIETGLDLRLELVSLAHLLAPRERTPKDFAPASERYARALEARFGAHRGHRAAALAAGFDPKRFGFRARLSLIAHYSDPPRMAPVTFVPFDLSALAGGEASVRDWIAALCDLARAARFARFWPECARELSGPVDRLRAAIRRLDPVSRIEAYAGLSFRGSYRLSPSPFLAAEKLENVLLERGDATSAITTVLGPRRGPELEFEDSGLPGTVWHELGHGLFDALIDLCQDQLAARRRGRAVWREFGTWRQYVKEHVARAVMLRLIARHVGAASAREQLREELSDGLSAAFLQVLAVRLKAYEESRDTYPTLAHYHHRLLGLGRSDGPHSPVGCVSEFNRPFETPPRRRHALRLLELMLAGRGSPALLERRRFLKIRP